MGGKHENVCNILTKKIEKMNMDHGATAYSKATASFSVETDKGKCVVGVAVVLGGGWQGGTIKRCSNKV